MMLKLAHRDLHSLPDAAGVQIRCQSGSIWVTLDHDTRDIVLDPGQSFSTPEHRRAIIFALEPARVSLEDPRDGREVAAGVHQRTNPTPHLQIPPATAGA